MIVQQSVRHGGVQRRFYKTSLRASYVRGPHLRNKRKPGMKPTATKVIMTRTYRRFEAGFVAQVTRGFGRKLLRNGMAVPATAENLRRFAQPMSVLAAQQREAAFTKKIRKLTRMLKAKLPVPTVSRSSNMLYYAVTREMVAGVINESKAAARGEFHVQPEDVHLPAGGITTTGEHSVHVSVLGIDVNVPFLVINDRTAKYEKSLRGELKSGGVYDARGKLVRRIFAGEENARLRFFNVTLPKLEEDNDLHLTASNDTYVRQLSRVAALRGKESNATRTAVGGVMHQAFYYQQPELSADDAYFQSLVAEAQKLEKEQLLAKDTAAQERAESVQMSGSDVVEKLSEAAAAGAAPM